MHFVCTVLIWSMIVFSVSCGEKESADIDINTDIDIDADADTDTDTDIDTDTDSGSTSLPERDGCQTADDCNGDPCITVGEVKVCQHSPSIWYYECPVPNEEENECCIDSDCTNGSEGLCAAYDIGYCGGPMPPESNVCQYSGCASDTDCSDGVCLPAGVLGSLTNACLSSNCTSDSDCTDGSDGQCALIYSGQTCPELLLSCVYTEAECRQAQGCDNGILCVADSNVPGGASCQEEQPPPNAFCQ